MESHETGKKFDKFLFYKLRCLLYSKICENVTFFITEYCSRRKIFFFFVSEENNTKKNCNRWCTCTHGNLSKMKLVSVPCDSVLQQVFDNCGAFFQLIALNFSFKTGFSYTKVLLLQVLLYCLRNSLPAKKNLPKTDFFRSFAFPFYEVSSYVEQKKLQLCVIFSSHLERRLQFYLPHCLSVDFAALLRTRRFRETRENNS